MDIQVTARHFHAHDSVRSHAVESVKNLSKYYDGIVNAEIILCYERPHESVKIAEIALLVFGKTLVAKEKAAEFPIAIDAAVENLERQIMKYKEKHHDLREAHRVKETAAVGV